MMLDDPVDDDDDQSKRPPSPAPMPHKKKAKTEDNHDQAHSDGECAAPPPLLPSAKDKARHFDGDGEEDLKVDKPRQRKKSKGTKDSKEDAKTAKKPTKLCIDVFDLPTTAPVTGRKKAFCLRRDRGATLRVADDGGGDGLFVLSEDQLIKGIAASVDAHAQLSSMKRMDINTWLSSFPQLLAVTSSSPAALYQAMPFAFVPPLEDDDDPDNDDPQQQEGVGHVDPFEGLALNSHDAENAHPYASPADDDPPMMAAPTPAHSAGQMMMDCEEYDELLDFNPTAAAAAAAAAAASQNDLPNILHLPPSPSPQNDRPPSSEHHQHNQPQQQEQQPAPSPGPSPSPVPQPQMSPAPSSAAGGGVEDTAMGSQAEGGRPRRRQWYDLLRSYAMTSKTGSRYSISKLVASLEPHLRSSFESALSHEQHQHKDSFAIANLSQLANHFKQGKQPVTPQRLFVTMCFACDSHNKVIQLQAGASSARGGRQGTAAWGAATLKLKRQAPKTGTEAKADMTVRATLPN